jgi:NADH-quinone oxidoreductase subunit F
MLDAAQLNQVCYATLQFDTPWAYDNYVALGGYAAWHRILRGEMTAEQIIDELKTSNLRGRGGAGFPVGIKWSFMPRNTPGQKYIVCNSDESEPGTCKDRDLLTVNPHALIEGMAIGGFTMGASVGYNYLRGEFMDEVYTRVEQALAEAYEHGWLGRDIAGSGIDFDLYNVLGAGAYICGEETALLESLEGKKGLPRFKPPFPAQYGVYGRPTTVNNTETLASVPTVLHRGGDWFAGLGVENAGGTKIFSVSGHTERPGNFEIPLGTPFAELLEMAGGVRHGRELKAVIPGGSSVPVVPGATMLETNMDFDAITKSGSMLGSGAVIVMDDQTDMVEALRRISRFYMSESCGQCTPCREGTGWLYRMVTRIVRGQASLGDLDRLEHVARRIEGRTICALGDAAAMPVRSFLRHFRPEFEHYIEHGQSVLAARAGKVAGAVA